MKRLTIVAPVFNEAKGIRHFYSALKQELDRIAGWDSFVIFVDDGSADESFDILKSIAAGDARVSVLRLSRNFGHQAALLAGMDAAEDGVVITMDSDMQHPPAVLPALLGEHEKGFDVVYTYREAADDSGPMRRAASSVFYSIVNLISDVPINRNASDFRLISARVADLFRTRMRERNMFMRGIISWVGFSQSKVTFKAERRHAGRSTYSLSRRMQLALFGIISFSKKPLRAAIVVGLLSGLFGFGFAIVTVIQYFFDPSFVPGFATTTVLLSIFGGMQLFFLGVIGEYIGSIFDEVKARPHYLIEETISS